MIQRVVCARPDLFIKWAHKFTGHAWSGNRINTAVESPLFKGRINNTIGYSISYLTATAGLGVYAHNNTYQMHSHFFRKAATQSNGWHVMRYAIQLAMVKSFRTTKLGAV